MTRRVGFDLFRWAVGIVEVGTAIFLLIVPSQLVSPAYAYIGPRAGLYGVLLLIAGGQFVTLAAIRPVADRRPGLVPGALSSLPLFYLAYGYAVAGSGTSAVINLALGLGCLVGPFLVRRSDPPTPTVTGDVLFYAIALAQVVDGALILLAPTRFPREVAAALGTSLGVLGVALLIGGILLFVAHAIPKVPYWFLGVTHIVAALAFLGILYAGLTTEGAWIRSIDYFVLDGFLLASPFFYGRPGLLRSDTLAVRLSALIVLIAAVPLIYLSIVTSNNIRTAFQDHVRSDQLVLAEASANRLSDLLATSEREVDALGHFGAIRSLDPSTQGDALVGVSGALTQFTVLATCDLDGDEVARSDGKALAMVGDQAYFQTARSGYVTWQYTVSSSLNQPVIIFAAPIRGSDERVGGVLFGMVQVPGLAKIIDENALESGSRVFLVDERGQVLAQSDNPPVDAVQRIPDLPSADGAVSLTLAGRTYLAGVSTVKPQGWRIVVAIQQTTAFAAVDQLQNVTLLTFIIAIAGVLLAAGAVARLIARPIAQLTLAAEALERGDDRAPLPARVGGEVGVLVNSFGSMRDALRSHAATLLARERRARGVASVVVALGHSHGFDGALLALCRELRAVLACAFCAVYLEEGSDLVVHAMSCVDERLAALREMRVPSIGSSLAPSVFSSGVPALVTDVAGDPRLDPALAERLGVKEVMVIPVTVGGQRRGVLLAIDTERADRFGMPELELARAVVSTADLVLENAHLDEENDRRRVEAERLATMNAELYAAERAASDALRESQAEIESFVYTVSHDLRAPLVTIQGFTHRVLQSYGGVLDERGRNYLERVQNNARRLEALINDLLQLSRIGRADLDVQSVRLDELAEEVRGQLAVQLESKGITFIVPKDLPTITANRYRAGQVLENLVGNAILYMGNPTPPRDPSIAIDARELANGWQISVSDNGIGIPPEHRERIFNVFERLAAGKAAHPDGTGIGLATVRKIVETHGGRVWAEETPGGGATIVFTVADVASARAPTTGRPRMIADDDQPAES